MSGSLSALECLVVLLCDENVHDHKDISNK